MLKIIIQEIVQHIYKLWKLIHLEQHYILNVVKKI